jgi:hypothetical protein
MVDRRVFPGVAVVLGVGIVAAVAVALGGAEATPEAEREERSTQVLSARSERASVAEPSRMDLDPRSGDDPAPVRLPDVRPEASAGDERARAAEPQPPPPPPRELTAEEMAAEAAFTALRDKVAREVGAQVKSQSSKLARSCGASGVKYSLVASFDAEGKMVASGLSDVRGSEGSPEVGACVRSQPLALQVEPPGQGVTVGVPLEL